MGGGQLVKLLCTQWGKPCHSCNLVFVCAILMCVCVCGFDLCDFGMCMSEGVLVVAYVVGRCLELTAYFCHIFMVECDFHIFPPKQCF